MTAIWKKYGYWLLGLFGLELLSLLAYFVVPARAWIFCLIMLAALVLARKSFDWLVLIAIAELFIGSKGYLLFVGGGQVKTSLRIGLFAIIMIAWAIRQLYKKEIPALWLSKWRNAYLAMAAVIIWGTVWGLFHNFTRDIFLDVNGWLYFAYALPFYEVVKRRREQLLPLLAAAVTITFVKTITTFLLFTQGAPDSILSPLYSWLRNTGVGEITFAGDGTNNLWRVFFQSQMYSLVALVGSWAMAVTTKLDWRKQLPLWGVMLISSWTIVLSLSRSFWLGGAVSLVLITLWLIWKGRQYWKTWLLTTALLVIFVSIQYTTMNIWAGAGTGDLVSARLRNFASDAAGSSRRNQLLPLLKAIAHHPVVGSGFGTAVTYISQDPRIVAAHPDGQYTTTAFEWGYLDMILKFGLAGLAIYAYLVVLLVYRLTTNPELPLGVKIGLIGGLVAIGVTSVVSPYLNHPLGIGWVVVVSVVGEYS